MRSSQTTYTLILLLLFSLVTQVSLAAEMPCQMDGGDMAAMHQMMADQAEGDVGDSCCDDSGVCTMKSCLSLVSVVSTTRANGYNSNKSKIDLYRFSDIESEASSLFRPPVFC